MPKTSHLVGFRVISRPLILCITLGVAVMVKLQAADYYIDPTGNDSNSGTSAATAWQSLSKVNGTIFQPGDNVLFKRGGTWVGTLSPQGSGNSTSQITLGAYGTGAKPLINGNGNWATITLSSQSYWTIQDFEVTNPASNDSSRSGIRVDWSGSGTMRGINILNNDVHDVRGIKNVNDGGRNNGGIFFWINEPGKADGVLIQGNTVKTIYGQGINFNGEAEYAGGGMNYANCSPNVIARGNTVISTSGDGILMLGTDNELVEHNEVGYVGQLSDNGNNIAAAWPTRHVNGLWQYNHVHHTKWLNANDSTAFDNDGFLSGATVFQYNYSHDNEGGFLMEYTWGGDDPGAQTIVRYNISWNENRVLASNRNSARIYNNVFYNPGGTLDVTWTPNQSYILFSNNLFVAAARSAEFSRQLFMNNNFSGGVTRPVTIDGNRTQDPLFVSPNTTGNLAGFILQSTSPVRNAGFIISGNGGKDFWGTTLPSTAPHRGASQINAIGNYTATPSLMQVTGPYSAAIPYSGTSTVNFSATVRDQNFRPISGAAVTWSVAPALAGYSITSSGVLTLSAGAQPQRVAIVAQSGSATATFSFTALPAVPPVVGSTWINPAGGQWSVAGNWQGNAIANGADQTATVALSTGVTINQGDTNRSIGHLAFRNANHAIQGNPLTLDVTTGSSSISVAESTTATLGLALVSSDGIQKTGTGTLALTAVSSYGGGTTVNQGTLELRGASGGTSLINGAVTVNSGAALALTAGDGTGFGWSNTISSLTINGGTVNAAGSSHLGFGSFASVALNAGGTIAGNWQWNGDSMLGFTSSGEMTNTINGLLNLRADAGANHTFNVANGAAAVDLQINATLADQYPEVSWVPASNFIKTGAGSVVLAASNSYDGITEIQSGTLVTAHSSALGAGGWSGSTMTWIRNGGTLGLQSNVSIGEHFHLIGSGVGGQGALRSLSGNNALTLTYGGSGSGPGYCFDGHTTVGVDTDTLTVTGFYEDGGSFGLTKVGSGTLHLTHASTYTGNTTVNAGTLRLGNGSNNSNLANGSNVIVSNVATLHLDYSGTDTVNALSFAGSAKPPGIYSAANSSFITGIGTLTVLTGPASDYQSWVTFHSLTGGQTGDDDNDGVTNSKEYAFGLNPKSGASTQPIISLPNPSTGTFSYTRRQQSLTGLTYTVWYSTNLSSWTQDNGAVQGSPSLSGEVETVPVTLSNSLLTNSKLFIQVRAQ